MIQAALLAAESNHVLWTDDGPFGMVASGEFGAARIWTQPALHHRRAAGYLDLDVLAEADARLIGWNYVTTRFDAATIARAGRLAGWDAGRWPFRAAMDLFAKEGIELGPMLRIAAELVVQIHKEVAHPTTRAVVAIDLIERLASRRLGLPAVARLAEIPPAHFGLNVVRAEEAGRVVDAWLRFAESRRSA